MFKHTLWWDKKWVLAWLSFGECTARVKLELTDFSEYEKQLPLLLNELFLRNQCIQINEYLGTSF